MSQRSVDPIKATLEAGETAAVARPRQRGGVLSILLWIVVAIFLIGLLVVIGTGKLLF